MRVAGLKRLDEYSKPVGEKYIDVLDGVRALLVFLVGWFHIWQQSWLTPRFTVLGQEYSLDFLLRSGYMWVDGLLLLSGFLLYLPYAGLKPGEAFPSARAFYRKRFWRIFPSYALNVLVFFLLSLEKYDSVSFMLRDLLSHLTFTQTLSYDTYFRSPINGALWTLGVEVMFYLIFPLLGRLYKKHSFWTAAGMMAAAFAWRYYAGTLSDCGMLFNQLPAFLDVYALGFIGADCFVALRGKLGEETRKEKAFFTGVCLVCLAVFSGLAHTQASMSGQEGIRLGQMSMRFMLALTMLLFMLSAAFAAPCVRFLLGNRLMRFLSAVSFQFYMYHQVLAVLIKKWGWIPSVSGTPNVSGEWSWQILYTLTCFLVPLALSAALTYGFEKPLIRLSARRKERSDHQKSPA